MARCLVSFGLSLSVLLYLVHARREGYVETAFLCRLAKVFTACLCSKYQNTKISCAGIYVSLIFWLNNSTKNDNDVNSFLASSDFANRLDPDQDRQNVCPDLDPNC